MNNEISKRLKEIRLENKFNQSKLGELLGVSQDTISLWENGKSLPDVETIIMFCKKFNISSDYLLGLED